MDKMFWIDKHNKLQISYDKLLYDLNNRKEFKSVLYTDSTYDLFVDLLLGILNNKNIEILDYDLTIDEVNRLSIETGELLVDSCMNEAKIEDSSQLRDQLMLSSSLISLYTSGTTGKPKKITHDFKNITRMVKIDNRFDNDIWAFAYNPTHFAGLQVFFQAIMNLNTMVYMFKVDKEAQQGSLSEGVTRISATPTFYRTMIGSIKETYPLVRTVTSGGEKFDESLRDDFERVFPNARIVNIYASTEAGSLFNSKGDYFSIPVGLSGKIKVSQESELMLHSSLIGNSSDVLITDGYYNTGDVVEFLNDNEFRFVSRNSDFINVGGYRVNPLEVEQSILELDSVHDVVVYGRKNSVIGNVVVAEIVHQLHCDDKKKLKAEIDSYLMGKLQDWKRPRIYKFVEQISKTRTGKKDRKR
jgi:acyl-coenzyme A synthetase/AMP-(fatty) acid ligase